jgi:hypothetical protein
MVWLLRGIGRVLRWAVLAAALAAAAPVTIVAAVGFAGAWLRGWPPARLRRAACWALPMTGVYLAGRALQVRTWQALALAPIHDWQVGWHRVIAGPGGDRIRVVRAGRGPGRAVRCGRVVGVADLRDRKRAGGQDRHRAGRVRCPAVAPRVACRPGPGHRAWRFPPRRHPRAGRDGCDDPCGGASLAADHRGALRRDEPPPGDHRRVRVREDEPDDPWAGWYAAALAAHYQHKEPRPLLIVLDCKGGPDARTKAARTRTLLHAAGARRVAIWPDETTVSLWGLPPAELAVTLFQLIETGTGGAAYYADVTQAVITLAVTAPPQPPGDGTAFLDRLETGWLQHAWTADPNRHQRRAGRSVFGSGTSPYSAVQLPRS